MISRVSLLMLALVPLAVSYNFNYGRYNLLDMHLKMIKHFQLANHRISVKVHIDVDYIDDYTSIKSAGHVCKKIGGDSDLVCIIFII